MLKKSIAYMDYNDEPQTEDLYFNLTRLEVADLLPYKERLNKWEVIVKGADRKLTNDEILDLIDIFKILVEMAYGQRSEDGKHFRKSPEIFRNFKESAAYDELVFGMFANPENAVEFMTGILPKNMFPEDGETVAELPQPAEESEVPAYIREDRDPTHKELQSMSPDEMRAAFARKTAKKSE